MNNNASSIGVPGEISIDEINNRIRLSMSDESINTRAQMKKLIEDVKQQEKVSELDTDTLRKTLRFIGKSNFIDDQLLCDIGERGMKVESESLLSGRYEGYSMYYVGENGKNRKSTHEKDITRYQKNIISSVDSIIPVAHDTIIGNFESRTPGYEVSILSNPQSIDIQEIAELYKNSYYNPVTQQVEYPFELNEENVLEMLSSSSNIVGIVRNSVGGIISVGIGEVMESLININGQESGLNIMEISDTATFLSYNDKGEIIKNLGGKGFNKILIMEIISNALGKYGDDLDLTFGEVRAALDSVNYLAVKTGREYNGTLSDSVLINGLLGKDMETSLQDKVRGHKYGDLNVMSMNNEAIKKLYKQ